MNSDFNINNIIPVFTKPSTKIEALKIAEKLVGEAWDQFSSVRSVPGATWDLLGGHAFLGKRVKGPEWYISQSLCWLCGQGKLSSKELIIALGRNPKLCPDKTLEEQITGAVRSSPPQELVERIHSYALEIYPVAKYEKKKRFYDEGLPLSSTTPYIYVIEDVNNDIKIGISINPKTRFRTIESYEDTVIKRYFCSKATSYAYTIEQMLLNRYGSGRNPTKKSREWLWQVSFEEVCAAVSETTLGKK